MAILGFNQLPKLPIHYRSKPCGGVSRRIHTTHKPSGKEEDFILVVSLAIGVGKIDVSGHVLCHFQEDRVNGGNIQVSGEEFRKTPTKESLKFASSFANHF
jgi:hypothetical protein